MMILNTRGHVPFTDKGLLVFVCIELKLPLQRCHVREVVNEFEKGLSVAEIITNLFTVDKLVLLNC